ncbi:hypothetical protein QF050_003220 [Arthrobacter sp. SLBN-112]|nr:hypothetical protein [Arthrobacter sp. SLBN-112]
MVGHVGDPVVELVETGWLGTSETRWLSLSKPVRSSVVSVVVAALNVRPSGDDWCMGKAAVVGAFEDIRAALAVLVAEVDGCGVELFSVADPLAGLADGCLDVLAGVREVEARVAGLKAKAAVGYADAAGVVAGPGVPVVAQEMAVAAEIGCVLSLGPRAASSFLATSHALATSLPLTFAALQAGTLSWGHAVAMADETAALDPAGAAALEGHFLDPGAPDPARGCPVGELPAHRFRAKARTWPGAPSCRVD